MTQYEVLQDTSRIQPTDEVLPQFIKPTKTINPLTLKALTLYYLKKKKAGLLKKGFPSLFLSSLTLFSYCSFYPV